MIYLHCGWPKTGSTSLRTFLAEQREPLAAEGYLYPDPWRWRGGETDSGLRELLQASPGAAEDAATELAAIREERRHLGKTPDVLISAEAVTAWLVTSDNTDTFLHFLARIGELDDVQCIWTIRRLDEVAVSLSLQLGGRHPRPDPTEMMRTLRGELIFSRMCEVEGVVSDSAYLKYGSDGRHNVELLRTCEIPAKVAAVIERQLHSTRTRKNRAMTQKQAIALRDIESLSSRLGTPLARSTVAEAFRSGFRFADDVLCNPVAPETRRELHERTLRAARECDFEPYSRFFGDDEIDVSRPLTELSFEVLTTDDVDRLRVYLQDHSG